MTLLPPASAALCAAYNAESFRREGHRLVDALADSLAQAQRGLGRVLPTLDPVQGRAQWALQPIDLMGGADPLAEWQRIIAASTTLHDPRCAAHQVAPPLPLASLSELVAAHLNNGMAIFEMGPAAVPIELTVLRWFTDALGWPSTAGGCLTSGGSLGNLTAMLAIRQLRGASPYGANERTLGAEPNVWREGAHAGPPLAVVTSAQAHYSVARALKIMGWGDAGVITAPVDEHFRLTGAAVEAALVQAQSEGRKVIAIVASAGSTATGACDHLDELADVAATHKLWLHVDGAHGASLALAQSPTLRAKLRGIERADSVVWDAHKMLMMPALVTAVLFRNEQHVYASFAQQAAYLFAPGHAQATWWDLGQRTVECTKRMMAMELYVSLRVHGAAMFTEIVERQCALGQRFAQLVAEADDFELALLPDLNIVCYRYQPPSWRNANSAAIAQLQREVRAALVADGSHYIVATTLPSGYWLRSAFMNSLATEDDLQELLQHLRRIGRTIAA
ncbi:MAG: pyridoxal-dependent decarboxylase [Kofleriaceae bacterium]|nr:pyridoxal-dependent decarboxylase [Kofleriaceae bacterium]